MKLAMDSSSCHSEGGRDGWVGSRRKPDNAFLKRGSARSVWNNFVILLMLFGIEDRSRVGILTR